MRSDSTKANKWTGPDEINGVLHVGKGYRPAGMNMADRLRTDREQWYPGDSENGENGIWGDARPGSFDPSKVYRVPVERKDEPGIHGDAREGVDAPPVMQNPPGTPYSCKVATGYRFGNASDRLRIDRMEWIPGIGSSLGWWCEAIPGAYHPSRLYQVPREISAASYSPSQDEGTTVPPPVGEFEDCGREGGPDCQTGEFDAVEREYLTAADFLRDDAVDHPNHYNDGSIECIDAIQAALTEEEFIGFCKGNAMKYIWREQWKNGMEDLQKAAWYLNRATEGLEAAE
jgi:hypothetical protein